MDAPIINENKITIRSLFLKNVFFWRTTNEIIINPNITKKYKFAPLDPNKKRQKTNADKIMILKIDPLLYFEITFIKNGSFIKKLKAVILIFPEKALNPISLEYNSPVYLVKNLSYTNINSMKRMAEIKYGTYFIKF